MHARAAKRASGLSPARLIAVAAALIVAEVPEPPLALADAAKSRAHFDKGRAYFQISEYRKALEEFKAAHIEKPDPAYLYNIAECHRHLGETAEAAVFYRRFLGLTAPDNQARGSATKYLAEMESPAAAPAPPASAGAPPGAAATPPAGKPGAPPAPPIVTPPASTAPPPLAPEPQAEPQPQPAPPPPPAPPAAAGAAAVAVAPAGTQAERSGSPPVYKRGWFYVVVGVVVVGAAAGIWALSGGGPGVPDSTLGNREIFR
jgi:hypothetical protein